MNGRTSIVTIVAFALLGFVARSESYAQEKEVPAQQPMASARFTFGGNAAQIPAEFIGELVFLPVHVNQGKPSLFELDSTAAVSSADPDRAAQLGIADLKNPVLNLSGVDISLAALATIRNKDFGAQVGQAYEGTLGNDIFAGAVIDVDYARQTVRIYDPAGYQYSGPGKSLPITLVGGMPVVQAKLSAGGHKNVEGSFVVNTALGASIVVSEKFAQAHRLISSHTKTVPDTDMRLGGGQSAVFARVEEFQLGPYLVEEPIAAFSKGSLPGDTDPRVAGEIGAGMLRRFRVVFDYPRQEMILAPNSEFRSEDREDMSGISIVATAPGYKTFEVAQVRSGTPGSDAGVQKGDIIAGVDGEAASDLSLEDIRDLFRQVGHKYKLQIERNGKTLTPTIQTRRLL